jgi:hypothetical protein
MWGLPGGGHVLTAEPYHVEGDDLSLFTAACSDLGLRLYLSGGSPYYPGRTLLLVVERADELGARPYGPARSASA